MSTFDTLIDEQNLAQQKSLRPFWTLDFKDDKPEGEFHNWLVRAYETDIQRQQRRRQQQKMNLSSYRGVEFTKRPQALTSQDARGVSRRSKNPKVSVNHFLDIINQHVSRVTKFRPAVAAEPASNDHFDQMVAKVCDELMESFWQKVDIDDKVRMHNRVARLLGESFIFPLWNENIGPWHPDWIQEQFKAHGIDRDPKNMKPAEIKDIFRNEIKEIKRIPLIDPSTGQQVQNGLGEDLFIDKPMRIGDIEYKMIWPWNVFTHYVPHGDRTRIEWLGFRESMDVDTARALWPEKAELIQVNSGRKFLDVEELEDVAVSRQVEVYRMFHRTTEALDQGREVIWTRDCVLENKPNMYEIDDQKVIPVDWLVDIDVPAVTRGDSTAQHIRPLQHLFNNAFSMVARNEFIFSHPKWFVPNNSINVESLSNQQTVVTYKGDVTPVMSQPNPTGQGTINWMDRVEENMQKIGGIFGQSRGEPPKGITAAVALSFLDEQESERSSESIANHNKSIRNLARQTAALMGNFYDESDDRLRLILGKSRASELEWFKFADLTGILDMRLHTASALPRQKSTRIQTLLDLSERFPGKLDDRQVLDMLDLGQKDKFISVATTAVRAAEAEEQILDERQTIPDPDKSDDHLMHYRIHLSKVNDPAWKVYATKKQKEAMNDHLSATEMLMLEIMEVNPMYVEQVVTQYPQFPAFHKPGREKLAGLLAPPIPPEAALPPEALPAMEAPLPPELNPETMPMDQAADMEAQMNELLPTDLA